MLGKAVAAADLLTALDTNAGQPVPALLTTNAHTLALLVGGAAADRPLAPIGARLTAAELTKVVRNTSTRVILTEPQFVQTAEQVADAVGARSVVVSTLPISTAQLPPSGGPVSFYCTPQAQPESPNQSRLPTPCWQPAPTCSAN